MTERQQGPLSNADNAAQIFFTQSARRDLRDRPRAMVATDDGDWQPVTWGVLASRVERIAAFLVQSGLASGEKAAVFGEMMFGAATARRLFRPSGGDPHHWTQPNRGSCRACC